MPPRETIEISASVARVWRLLDDPDLHPLWIPDLVSITYPDGRPKDNPVGARFIQCMRENGREREYSGRVTTYEDNLSLGAAVSYDDFDIAVTYDIAKAAGGSLVGFTSNIALRNPFLWLATPVAGLVAAKKMRGFMANLKRVAEDRNAFKLGRHSA